MERNEIGHQDNGARPAVEVLRSLLALRAQKQTMNGKEYKRQRDLLWAQAELTVETSDDTLTKSAPAAGEVEQRGGATITHRPDLQYEAERDVNGTYSLHVKPEERDYLGRKLRDDAKEGVPAASNLLHNLGISVD